MPNYRYNMPDYERRNTCGNHTQAVSYRQHPQGCNSARESYIAAPSPCEPVRNSCEIPRRDCHEEGEMSCAVSENYDALAGMPIAMAYVPWQMWRGIYDVEKAFCRGTIFEELDKPFRGIGGVR